MRGQGVAPAVHASHAIGVAVGDQANVVRIFFEIRRTWPVVVDDWLGMDAAKKRIVLGVQRGHLTCGTIENLFKGTRPHSEQGIMRKTQAGL